MKIDISSCDHAVAEAQLHHDSVGSAAGNGHIAPLKVVYTFGVLVFESLLLNTANSSVCPSVCLSLCGLVIQIVSAPSYRMGREGGRHQRQNTRSRAAPNHGRGVLELLRPLRGRPDNHQASLAAEKQL